MSTKDYAKEGYVKATVVDMSKLDGCGFVLQLASGTKLEPANLSADFKKDKLNVWVKYTDKKGGQSVCMVGKMVNITAIEIRKEK